jgi:segregation and condensation protein A
MSVAVKLEIFEGPLDLLLHLIRKNEVDIQDIPVALITRQYLDYLDLLHEMNIGVAGEFLVMAATLTQIKSKMLLPSFDKSDLGEEEEDPRIDLVAQLKEHMRIKTAAQELDRRPRVGRDIFQRESGREEVEQAVAEGKDGVEIQAGVFDLVTAFRRLIRYRNENLELALPTDNISLEDRMSQVLEMLKQRRNISFDEFFSGVRTRPDLVVTFLALLELIRLGLMKAFQSRLEPAGEDPAWGTLRLVYTPEGAMEPEEAAS